VSAISEYFETVPYSLDEKTGREDYDALEFVASLYRPKIDAYLMADIAHISGMISAGALPSPFDYCDIVTTTTHKSLRGPRGALIFYRKGVRKVTKKGEGDD